KTLASKPLLLEMKQKSTILIVDDDSIGRETLNVLLCNQGYNLAFAVNGPEALIKAADLNPDVILLDVMMPGMDGFEVCRRLRKDTSLANVPILMLTSLGDRESRLQGIEAGADDFISKPFDTFELRARLKTITKLNRYHTLLVEQAKFEWVVEQADDAYVILDHNDQIFYANSQARKYFNLQTKQDEPIGEKFLELATKHYHCEPQQAWTNWLEYTNQSSPRYLVHPETSNAHALWLQVDVMEMSRGTGEKYLVRLRNVTDTILAERRKWTFQGQIRHKLKTPLSPITMGLEYLKSNYADLSDTDRKEFIEIAYSGATRLHAEIEEIFRYLDVSDVLKPEFGICQITDILLIIDTIQEDMALKSVHVSQKNIKNPDNISIFFSPQAMELVLTELLSNAKKFHPEGSPRLEINISAVPEGLCLQVCDDGLQLSPEQMANIWTPFYQGEKSFTGEAEGMGLGLSMVASLIWEIGGTCHAYNRKEKKGIIIELTLPFANTFEV
ncbi:MAG: response regulator, partial [Thiomargarita sp.]|nr:response regulator [Thiomargarita sp.]